MARTLPLTLVGMSLLLVDARTADACATAPPAGEEVQIAEEEAIILWDPATRTEHFIRRAAFRSSASSFGFLVPTPTVPTLGEVPDHVFGSLAHAIRPEIRYDTSGTDVELASLTCVGTKRDKSEAQVTGAAPDVRVLATARVAGFDAITLEADDPSALSAWLGEHGFAATPALTAWLARYVADKWKITAFVVATDATGGAGYEVATRAVRMSFQTDRPFYPYREPEPAAKPAIPTYGRLLRLFFLSDARYAATLAGQPWSARLLYGAPIGEVPDELAAFAGMRRIASVFVDESHPRKGTDEVYFAASPDQAEVEQPPIVLAKPDKIVIPIELIGIALVGIVVLIVRRRR
jgi:hypothetical protein